MKLKSLIAAVRKEFSNIKKYATVDEVYRLVQGMQDPYIIRATDSTRCVYGIMTGNCFSKRAHELIEKCASLNKFKEDGNVYLSDMIHEKPVKHKERSNEYKYFSYLEVYLASDKISCINIGKKVFAEELKN